MMTEREKRELHRQVYGQVFGLIWASFRDANSKLGRTDSELTEEVHVEAQAAADAAVACYKPEGSVAEYLQDPPLNRDAY